MDDKYQLQGVLLWQPEDHHYSNMTSTDHDIFPTVLIIWECFLEILAVIIYLILTQHKATRYIVILVISTSLTNTVLLLLGPVQDMKTFTSITGELAEQQPCKSLSYFLYTTMNYTLWTAVSWIVLRVVRVDTPRHEIISRLRNVLGKLLTVFIIQNVFIYVNITLLSQRNSGNCLNNVVFRDGTSYAPLYFFGTFGLPMFVCLTVSVYIISHIGRKKYDSQNSLKNSLVKEEKGVATSLAIPIVLFVFMMVPACGYMGYLVSQFEENSSLTDESKKDFINILLLHKYVFANLVIYCNALLHLFLQVIIKERFVWGL